MYSGAIGELPGGYGACRTGDVPGPSAAIPEIPSLEDGQVGFFYLVTARNGLREEGTKGFDSAGAPRPNPLPCP